MGDGFETPLEPLGGTLEDGGHLDFLVRSLELGYESQAVQGPQKYDCSNEMVPITVEYIHLSYLILHLVCGRSPTSSPV